VHATVCKHVHTVHHLRSGNITETGVEESQSAVNAEDEVPVDDASVQSDTVDDDVATDGLSTSTEEHSIRSRLLSKCQHFMAEAVQCHDTEALKCALKHVQTAEASLHAIAMPCQHNTSSSSCASKQKIRQAATLLQHEKEATGSCVTA